MTVRGWISLSGWAVWIPMATLRTRAPWWVRYSSRATLMTIRTALWRRTSRNWISGSRNTRWSSSTTRYRMTRTWATLTTVPATSMTTRMRWAVIFPPSWSSVTVYLLKWLKKRRRGVWTWRTLIPRWTTWTVRWPTTRWTTRTATSTPTARLPDWTALKVTGWCTSPSSGARVSMITWTASITPVTAVTVRITCLPFRMLTSLRLTTLRARVAVIFPVVRSWAERIRFRTATVLTVRIRYARWTWTVTSVCVSRAFPVQALSEAFSQTIPARSSVQSSSLPWATSSRPVCTWLPMFRRVPLLFTSPFWTRQSSIRLSFLTVTGSRIWNPNGCLMTSTCVPLWAAVLSVPNFAPALPAGALRRAWPGLISTITVSSAVCSRLMPLCTLASRIFSTRSTVVVTARNNAARALTRTTVLRVVLPAAGWRTRSAMRKPPPSTLMWRTAW
jgi:hypothetical protein